MNRSWHGLSRGALQSFQHGGQRGLRRISFVSSRLSIPDRSLCSGYRFIFFVFFSAGAGVSFVAEVFFRFSRSSLANVSASQGAFTLPRDAGRSLSHSAEALSPPISRMVRPVSTEVSY